MPIELYIEIFVLHFNHLRVTQRRLLCKVLCQNYNIIFYETAQKIDIIGQAIRDLSKK